LKDEHPNWSNREIARHIGITPPTVAKALKRKAITGETGPRKSGRTKGCSSQIKRIISEQDQKLLDEIMAMQQNCPPINIPIAMEDFIDNDFSNLLNSSAFRKDFESMIPSSLNLNLTSNIIPEDLEPLFSA
jgi:hypothetical protein